MKKSIEIKLVSQYWSVKKCNVQEYSQKHKLNIKFDRNYYYRGDLIKKLSKYSAGIISLREAKVYKYGLS